MSLFAAYTNVEDDTQKQNEAALSFSSYKIDPPITHDTNKAEKKRKKIESVIVESDSEDKHISECDNKRKKLTHKKKHKKRQKKEKKITGEIKLTDSFNNQDYIEDKSKEIVFLKVDTIYRPAVPKYTYQRCVIGPYVIKPTKKKRQKRYFNSKYIIQTKDDDKEDLSDEKKKNETDSTPQNQAEDDITRKTAFYNQSLGKDPFDVEMWMQYVKFQDKVWLFEKTYKKGSIAKGGRVTAERKLAILDKALSHNPNNEILSREKVIIAENTYPADEVSNYLKVFVEKNFGNITYWQGYIEATQCSMAHCNTPAVINLYNNCLSKLHQLRRGSTLEKSLLEERILCMLYQCGLFLRQAGLWEQLWTLLQLYLELNLSSHDKSKFSVALNKFDEKELVELEEVILESKLPLHELWLRVEKLRESCHWLPWSESQQCEDPQRVVFINDVSDLIHPITSSGNLFRLTVTILNLLKIPLLPCRHTTIQELGLDYVPWALDTIETLYPVFFPLFPVNLSNSYLLKDSGKLAVGPQYLKTHPGQEEYLNFVIRLMKNCGDCLQDSERTAIFVWWLRFERLLIVLNKENRFKMPNGRNKKTKSAIKEFLKEELNRNNVLFYREYALIEYELGNFDNACKILLTAISMQSNDNPTISILNENERSGLCLLYRTLVEILLTGNINDNKTNPIDYLVTLVNGSTNKITSVIINETIDKYKQIVNDILNEKQKPMTASEHFLPDYTTDFIICYGWLLYLTRTPFEVGTMIENALTKLEQSDIDVLWRREVLMEFYVTIFFKTCTEKLGSGMFELFNDILHKSLEIFPNNLYLLAITCKEQSSSGCVGKPWWKLSNLLSNCGHAMPALFLVIMANQQLAKIKEQWDDFEIQNPVSTLTSFKNRTLSMFYKLTQTDMCSKRCGLLWRLYLQFLYTYSDSDSCRKAYYAAVEECPWLKALYIDAAIYIPAELPQIQDLIIEKQLRIHVTPEELDVLRS